MIYRAAADSVLVLHAAFVLFVMIGGLLVLRRGKLAWLHVPAVVWAAFVEFTGRICPLTPLEVALRERAGEAGYAGDFIEHYIAPLMYPDGLTRDTQAVLGALVVVVNLLIYAAAVIRWRRRPKT
jgi:Protein of Unknown function (DUF2784)